MAVLEDCPRAACRPSCAGDAPVTTQRKCRTLMPLFRVQDCSPAGAMTIRAAIGPATALALAAREASWCTTQSHCAASTPILVPTLICPMLRPVGMH